MRRSDLTDPVLSRLAESWHEAYLDDEGQKAAEAFFFQAEDGIRDVAVTGVQTCALPIFGVGLGAELVAVGEERLLELPEVLDDPVQDDCDPARLAARERMRVYLGDTTRSEEHTSELQSRLHIVCRLLLEKHTHRATPTVP